MTDSYKSISDRVQAYIDLMENIEVVDGGWGTAKIDSEIPTYNSTPIGNYSNLSDFDKLAVLGRYGNWVGGAYGDKRYSPQFDLDHFDLRSTSAIGAYLSELSKYDKGGAYYEDPSEDIKDEFDGLGRRHDLLYQEANLSAARALADVAISLSLGEVGTEEFSNRRQEILDTQERRMREADVWFIETGKRMIPSEPSGALLKSIGDVYFGLNADRYYLENLPPLPVDRVIQGVAEQYGSRLGKLIAGDNWLAREGGESLGKQIGKEVSNFFKLSELDNENKKANDLGTSIISFAEGDVTLSDLAAKALKNFGVDSLDKIEAKALSKLSSWILAEAAEELRLGDYEKYILTTSGKDLAGYFISELTSIEGAIGSNDLTNILEQGIDFSNLSSYLLSISLTYVANDFVSDLVSRAKSLADIDSIGEQYYVEFTSLVGSLIGSYYLPFLGGPIGETIGYLLGSINYEILNFISFGLLDDLFDGDAPNPNGYMYVGFDTESDQLKVIAQDWRKDGASNSIIQDIYTRHMEITNQYVGYVNGIIKSIGGTPELGYFYDIVPDLGVPPIDPTIPFRSHASTHFDTDHFIVNTYWGWAGGQSTASNDPNVLFSTAAAYELARLDFYGGDLAQVRAFHQWKTRLNDAWNASPISPPNPDLGSLNADLHIAKDYRFYLDNTAAINMLMTESPDTPFTLGWVATLARANELGLNQPYIGSANGAVGTSAAEMIKSADGDDLIFGNGGSDTIQAYGGNDRIYGGSGSDSIGAGFGDDLIGGDDGDDRLDGGEGSDSVFGFAGNDWLVGGRGNDQIGGEDGDDRIEGGSGNDVLFGDASSAGADSISGGAGDDFVRGGDGADTLFGDQGSDAIYGDKGADSLTGGASADTIYGGADNDFLDGNDDADEIDAGIGNDTVRGGPGNDRISSGSGNDEVHSGDGNDVVLGLAGDDFLLGDDGNDTLYADVGVDTLVGGAGDDILEGWHGEDTLSGGDGNDRLSGEDGADILDGGGGNDLLVGDRTPPTAAMLEAQAQVIATVQARLRIGDFAIIYQGDDYNVDRLTQIDHDLLIINPAKSISYYQDSRETLWTTEELNTIKSSGKTLAGYINLAKFNDFIEVWDRKWTTDGTAHGSLTASAPDFLGEIDSSFIHTRLVNYWLPDWRNILFSQVDRMISQGFDGIFLDDPGMYFSARGSSANEIAQAAREMRDLIIAVNEYALAKITAIRGADGAENFLIIINGAPFIISDSIADGSTLDQDASERFYGSLDAILAENYFSLGLQYAVDKLHTDYSSRGITLLSADTGQVTRQQQIKISEQAAANGLLPFVTDSDDYSTSTGRFTVGLSDTLVGGGDTLHGGAGADTLLGGADNDLYIVDASGDRVFETTTPASTIDAGGCDTVQSAVSINLDAHPGVRFVEHLVLTGTANLDGTGNALANSLSGNAGRNLLNGGEGADTLDGGAGVDSMAGGEGNDIYVVDHASDMITEAIGEGMDEVQASITWTLGANTERLVLTGSSVINGTGNALDNGIIGNARTNRLMGGDGADTLNGDGSTDTLDGGNGHDLLDGGTGADSMAGGAGNDIYVLDNAGDAVTEAAGEGMDEVQSVVTFTLGANIERLMLTGSSVINGTGNTLDNTITGNARNNRLIGGDGADTLNGDGSADTLEGGNGHDRLDGGTGADSMAGAAGNDVYIVDHGYDRAIEATGEGTDEVRAAVNWTLGENFERLVLTGTAHIDGTGNALNNAITGNAGNNILSGGLGSDSMAGGAGNDIYIVDHVRDVVTETAGGGMDEIRASVTWTMGANAERLLLTGASVIHGTGNALDNTITGNDRINLLGGGEGADTLFGGGSIDTLAGGIGDDLLNGGLGADSMAGGAGNDIYIVDHVNEMVGEAAAEGIDEVRATTHATLSAHVERLVLLGNGGIRGTGNEIANVIVGNAGRNILDGGGGADTLTGGAGSDTLIATAGDLFVFEQALHGRDSISGFDAAQNDLVISAAGFGGGLEAGMDLMVGERFISALTRTATSPAGVGQFILETDRNLLWWDADGSGGTAPVQITFLSNITGFGGDDIRVIA